MVINCIKFILVNDMKEQQNDDSVVNPLHNELVILLNNSFLRSRLILSRGNEEIDRLAGWACRHERASEEERQEDLKKLTESCNRCAGVEDRKIAIGTGVNRVMIILNESVDLLKKIIQAAGLSFGECYITNLVKCDANDPLIKPSQMVKNCEYIITREIEITKPRIVIVFGDIIPLQKIVKESDEILWYNIEHPVTLIKNPELKRNAWNTLKLIMTQMKELNIK
jgi:uracil-DNA glycosylase